MIGYCSDHLFIVQSAIKRSERRMRMTRLLVPSWRQLLYLLIVIIIVQFVVFLIGRVQPYSAYFQLDEGAWGRRLFRFRTDSKQSLANFRFWSLDNQKSGILFERGRKVCVGIMSEKESKWKEEILGSLLGGLKMGQEDDISIRIFNVQTKRKRETSSTFQSNGTIIEEDLVYPPYLRLNESSSGNIRKSTNLALILQRLYNLGCKYGLVMEDDLVAGHDWSKKVLEIVEETSPNWTAMRLVNEYSKDSFRWWNANELLLILTISMGSMLIVWLLTALVIIFIWPEHVEAASGEEEVDDDGALIESKDSTGSYYWAIDLTTPNLLILILLIVNFIIAIILLGRPNVFPAMANSMNKTFVTGPTQSYANLFPAQTMLEYSILLEEGAREARRLNGTKVLPHPDHQLWRLTKTLCKREEESWNMMRWGTSLFQKVGYSGMDIGNLKPAFDFPDNDEMISFEGGEFLEK